MNRMQLKQLSKKIDKILALKKLPVFPLLGGYPDEPSRNVTLEEEKILQEKERPCPISIALSREQEFLEYLKSE